MTQASARATAAEMAALRQRFPKPGAAAAVFQVATILSVNGYLVYLVATGQTSPVGIAVFNLAELVVLSAVSHLVLIAVPRDSRIGDAGTGGIAQKLIVMLLSLLWLDGIYWLSVSFDRAHIAQLRNAPDPLVALADLHILWPLLFSAGMIVFATLGDFARWRRKRGLFVPEYAMSAAPKILTLLLAPIPALLVSEHFQKTNLDDALLAWSATYLGLKCLFELGLFAWRCLGMPQRERSPAPA
jgi:hypothetical protein